MAWTESDALPDRSRCPGVEFNPARVKSTTMKILIWTLSLFLAAAWTVLALVASAVVRWASAWLSDGASMDVAPLLTQWTLPNWLLMWVDVQDIQALQMSLLAWAERLQGAWPGLGEAVGWLLPVIWLVWGLGFVCLLLLAGGLHLLIVKTAPRPEPPAVRSVVTTGA